MKLGVYTVRLRDKMPCIWSPHGRVTLSNRIARLAGVNIPLVQHTVVGALFDSQNVALFY
jgi:hypothetical protein